MGLLDDAIRDHLDLKRRHGADPTEVERAEREALGPVRRKGEAAATVEPEAVAPGAEDALGDEHDAARALAYDQAHDEPWDGEEEALAHEPTPLEFEESSTARRPEPEPDDEPAPRARGRLFGRRRHEPEDEPAVDEPTPPRRRGRPASADETSEFDVEDALAAQPEADDEDVLEETPEFLQDTPDHDRLWFEQRPPRDFDFDE